MVDIKSLIKGLDAQDLARVSHRSGGSARRDQKNLIKLIEKVEERLSMIGVEVEYTPKYDQETRPKKYAAWTAIYGEDENPKVSWPDFSENYAFGQDKEGKYYAWKVHQLEMVGSGF